MVELRAHGFKANQGSICRKKHLETPPTGHHILNSYGHINSSILHGHMGQTDALSALDDCVDPDHLHFAEQDRPRGAMPQKPGCESFEGFSTTKGDLPLRLMKDS